jgi:glycosyltransferase involved in cell wall biosynthesis
MAPELTVAINAQISPRYPGGVETMLLSLIRTLGRREGDERFVLCSVPKHAGELAPFTGPNQKVEGWPFPQGTFTDPLGAASNGQGPWAAPVVPLKRLARRWTQPLRLRRRARQGDRVLRSRGVAVVHFPYPLLFPTDLPYVYEPWDLQHRHHPEFFSRQEAEGRDRLFRSACERARLVITATRWAKRDLVGQYGLPADKVAVIPRRPLLAQEPLPEAERAEAWRCQSIPEGFAFYPAMTFPHKNHIALLQALARLRDERGIRLPLVCSGRAYEPHAAAVQAEAARWGLQDQVRFLGVVPDAMLASLFREARFMVFPSLFEGLGIPLLEAMYHRLPILAAASTCIPEVVGDGAVLFDGQSVDSIVQAMARAVDDPRLLDDLRSRGAAVLARFSWDKARPTFIACYRYAAGQPLTAEERTLLAEATGA